MSTCCKVVAALFFFLCATGGAQSAELTVNKIAAVVNGEMITLHDLKSHTAAELARRRMSPNDANAAQIQTIILDSLINDILLRQEAKRYKVTVSDADVEAETKAAMARSSIPADKFESELKKQGMTLDIYREKIRNTILRQRMASYMVQRKVFVTPEEVESYYHAHRADFSGQKTADFSIIILPEKLNVQNIYKQLSTGQLSFEEAAKRHSADRSASSGGRVEGIPFDRLPPDMQKLLTSLQDGKLSPMLRTQDGIAIIRRNAIRDAKPLTLEEARPRIEEILLTPLLEERFKEYIAQLRSKAVIDIRI